MALSGTINGTTANNKVTAKITWSAVQDTTKNCSTITATLTYSRTNSGYTTGGYWSGSLSIGSSTNTITSYYIEITQNSNTVAITHTAEVAHAADGTLSVKISATGKIANSTLSSTTVGATVTLDTIPRASSITSAGAVTLGNACSVRWTPNSSAFRYKLKFALGSWSYTTGAIHPNQTSAYTYTGYTIPLAVAEKITGSKEGTMTVTLTTYSDSSCNTSIGSDSETFKVMVPENENTQPTVTMELTPASPLEGLYIQGLSKVQATLSASVKLGADIDSYSMTVNGSVYESPYLSSYLTKAEDVEVTGCAVDSRGIPGYAKQTITVLPYYRPRLPAATAYRCTSDGVAADNGEYLRIEATRDYAPVVADRVQNNFCTIQYQYKAENAEKYSKPITILEADAKGNTIFTEPLLDGTLDKTATYVVQIIAVDTVGQSVTVTVPISSEQVFRHKRAGGKGLGLGGYCEEDDLLDVHWNQRVRKDLQVDGSVNIDGAMTVAGTAAFLGGKGLGLGGYCEEDDLLDVRWNQRVRKGLQVDGDTNIDGAMTVAGPASFPGGIEGNMLVNGYAQANAFNGVYIHSARTSGVQTFTVQSKWTQFVGELGRQTLFLFGEANYKLFYGVLALRQAGDWAWSGEGTISASPLQDGQFEITLPTTSYDYCTLISAEPFAII